MPPISAAARPLRRLSACLALSAIACGASAAPVTIDFESAAFVQGSAVGSAVAGVSFSNELVVQAGIDLNEFDFPPRSGSKALLDLDGPIRIDFATGVFSAGAYVTYAAPLQLEAFDANGALLGLVNAQFSSNFASDPGSVPNEFIGFADAGGRIASIRFTGDSLGVSFVLDDLSFDRGASNGVPEPHSLLLAAVALAGLAGTRRRRG